MSAKLGIEDDGGTIDYEAQERRIREIRAYAERELKLIRAERARRERGQKER